jgi:hypothetical protein
MAIIASDPATLSFLGDDESFCGGTNDNEAFPCRWKKPIRSWTNTGSRLPQIKSSIGEPSNALPSEPVQVSGIMPPDYWLLCHFYVLLC